MKTIEVAAVSAMLATSAAAHASGAMTLSVAALKPTTPAALNVSSCRVPDYPAASARYRAEGTTVLSLDVDAQGQVTAGRIKESSGHGRLDQAALRALSKCEFQSAMKSGVRVATTQDVRFVWKLDR